MKYLTRLPLDTNKEKTQVALTSPELFHGAIECSIGEEGDRVRNLWAIEEIAGKKYLLIMTDIIPDTEALMMEFGDMSEEAVTGDYGKFIDSLEEKSIWRFRITAEPTVCVNSSDDVNWKKNRGKHIPLTSSSRQREWVVNKGKRNGFFVKSLRITDKQDLICKKHGDIKAVTFSGTLEITDANLFKSALINGIGKRKAFGMGMLRICS